MESFCLPVSYDYSCAGRGEERPGQRTWGEQTLRCVSHIQGKKKKGKLGQERKEGVLARQKFLWETPPCIGKREGRKRKAGTLVYLQSRESSRGENKKGEKEGPAGQKGALRREAGGCTVLAGDANPCERNERDAWKEKEDLGMFRALPRAI